MSNAPSFTQWAFFEWLVQYCCCKQFLFIIKFWFACFILGKRQEIEIQHCLATLCYEAPVAYDENLDQLTALTRSSGKCSQEITLMCLLAPTKVFIYINENLFFV